MSKHPPSFLPAIAVLCLMGGCVPSVSGNGAATLPVLPHFNLGVPQGYCMDKRASAIADEGSTFLLGRCNDGARATPAVIRISLGGPGSAAALAGDPAGLADFFTSKAGRTTLSPTGNPADVQIKGALSQGNDFLLNIQTAAEGQYWRAISGIGGRLVTVSAIGAPGSPLSPEDSRNIVQKTMDGQRRANSGG